jgi:transcriptional regulator with XRE-family HTH domain
MKTLADRVIEERNLRDWSQQDLAKALRSKFGIGSQSTIASIELGDTPNPTCILELAKIFGVDPFWLKFGEGARERGRPPTPKVPVFGYAGAGERVNIIPGDGPMEAVPHFAEADKLAAVIVRGTSMRPAYNDGDLLFFKQLEFTREQILNRDCVVITDKDRSFVKRIESGKSGSLFDLVSYNPAIDTLRDIQLKQAWPVEWIRRG